MFDTLQDSHVVVVGGSSGIGLATARLAVAAGATVTVAGRDPERLATALADLGPTATGVTLDVADEAAVAALFDSLERVDHVANLAGTHANGKVVDVTVDALRGPVDNRFWGALHVCKHAAPRMGGTGSITLCTGAGVARPRAGAAIVAAACGGVEVLSNAMAVELAPVRVNVIRPGIVDTPLLDRLIPGDKAGAVDFLAGRLPLRRVAQPEEIAHAIGFLMTNTYVTGATLTVDGGSSLV